MKIYFAGSIRGGRGDQAIYLQVINLLKEYGEVLSEHIGDVDLTDQGTVGMNDTEIHERMLAWVREADAIVAEVTSPSFGVGWEVGFAESLGKKIICVYREIPGKRISAMVAGNKNLISKSYQEVAELKEVFDKFLK